MNRMVPWCAPRATTGQREKPGSGGPGNPRVPARFVHRHPRRPQFGPIALAGPSRRRNAAPHGPALPRNARDPGPGPGARAGRLRRGRSARATTGSTAWYTAARLLPVAAGRPAPGWSPLPATWLVRASSASTTQAGCGPPTNRSPRWFTRDSRWSRGSRSARWYPVIPVARSRPACTGDCVAARSTWIPCCSWVSAGSGCYRLPEQLREPLGEPLVLLRAVVDLSAHAQQEPAVPGVHGDLGAQLVGDPVA